ncbi:hypothetical protein KEM55_001931 [Ascosphaera atra]|nr:hypothetical protein KEM55_001931 [Ascosphaera atra]
MPLCQKLKAVLFLRGSSSGSSGGSNGSRAGNGRAKEEKPSSSTPTSCLLRSTFRSRRSSKSKSRPGAWSAPATTTTTTTTSSSTKLFGQSRQKFLPPALAAAVSATSSHTRPAKTQQHGHRTNGHAHTRPQTQGKTKQKQPNHARQQQQRLDLPKIKPYKPKIDKRTGKPIPEIYKPHEVPRSKYRGPFDQAHLDRLQSYSLHVASMERDRPRSVLSSRSPLEGAITWEEENEGEKEADTRTEAETAGASSGTPQASQPEERRAKDGSVDTPELYRPVSSPTFGTVSVLRDDDESLCSRNYAYGYGYGYADSAFTSATTIAPPPSVRGKGQALAHSSPRFNNGADSRAAA